MWVFCIGTCIGIFIGIRVGICVGICDQDDCQPTTLPFLLLYYVLHVIELLLFSRGSKLMTGKWGSTLQGLQEQARKHAARGAFPLRCASYAELRNIGIGSCGPSW